MAQLDGVRELTARLRALPDDLRKKVLRKSAMAAARVVRAEVKLRAPLGTQAHKRGSGRITQPGVLRKAVMLKFAKEKSNLEQATYIVTLRRGKSEQRSGRDAYYWPWVEAGHKLVRRGVVHGTVPAHPFFAPAYRQSNQKALEKMKSVMEIEVNRIIT